MFNEVENEILVNIIEDKISYAKEITNLTKNSSREISIFYENTLKSILNKLKEVEG